MELSSQAYKHKCKNGMVATIVFTHTDNGWTLSSCKYNASSNSNYSLNDWADLTELGHEILELNSKLN